MSDRRATGALETEVLSVLWLIGTPATPGDVRKALASDLAYTTVMTILARLWRKGLVSRERQGRAFAYEPRITEAQLAAERMTEHLDMTSDRAAALSAFVGSLKKRDEKLLRSLLDDE